MPYVLRAQLSDDDALVDLRSHWDVNFFRGESLAPAFESPVKLEIDVDSEGRRMPTIFTTPAFVARTAFRELLSAAGVDNVEHYPAMIVNPESGETIEGYEVLNIVGRVAAADLAASPGAELGAGARVLDEPALRRSALPSAMIFRLEEDPIPIIVSDALAERIRAAGFEDVYLEELAVTG